MLDIRILGNRIKQFRKEHNLTQIAFAEELHVSAQAVSNWERGIAPPELETLLRIASYFGILVDDLLRPQSERLVLGIDGGGTKTEFVVSTPDGHCLKRFLRSGSNPNDIGFVKMAAIISEGMQDAMVEFPSITAVFGGLSGISTGDHRKRLTDQLSQKYPSLKLSFRTDSANLFAMDDGADMALISGTGSVVFVRSGNEFVRLGGWGYLFDSAGSAYDIGRDAVTVALEENDTRRKPCTLSIMLKEHLRVENMWDAINLLYEGGKPYIASLSRIVFDAYHAGDDHAVAIIDRNAARLAELLNTGRRLYGVRPCAVAGGGLFEHHASVVLDHISHYTDTRLSLCGLPPIYGACREACRLLDKQIPESFYTNFQKTYGGLLS